MVLKLIAICLLSGKLTEELLVGELIATLGVTPGSPPLLPQP